MKGFHSLYALTTLTLLLILVGGHTAVGQETAIDAPLGFTILFIRQDFT